MAEWLFVTVAYGLTWTVLAGYLLYVTRRARRATAALERVEAAGDLSQVFR
jgi:heme exporter protein CcmD